MKSEEVLFYAQKNLCSPIGKVLDVENATSTAALIDINEAESIFSLILSDVVELLRQKRRIMRQLEYSGGNGEYGVDHNSISGLKFV